MALSTERYATGKKELLVVLRKWEARKYLDPRERGGLFDHWLRSVQDAGWTRSDVYRLVWEVLTECASQFSEATLDELGEIETALTGFCDENAILRFPNEPTDLSELVGYVRGNHWR